MKKLILSIALALSLGACTTLNVITTGVSNPVTKEVLYATENSAIVVFAALGAYKKSCVAGVIAANCKDTIRKVQIYTRQIPPALKSLRKFVKENDQVNAVVMYKTVNELINNFKLIAAQNNVPIGG